jgi:hypothetical protein
MHNATFIGGGPAGLAPLVWAARTGTLPQLADKGLVIIERGPTIGAGTLGHHAIGSDTLAETFLECLDNSRDDRLGALRSHPTATAVAAYRGGSIPLPVAASFLAALGDVMADILGAAGASIHTSTDAVASRRLADGRWCTDLRTPGGTTQVISNNLVLATGGQQTYEPLHRKPVAGQPLLPRFADKLMLSGQALAHGGVAEIVRRLSGKTSPKVVIVGGSHSALATANVLLNRCDEVGFGPQAITLMHRQPLRVFYPSAEAAIADGYTDFNTNDICPVSNRLFRLAGFRLDARDLVMRALEIGGRTPEPRLQLLQLKGPTSEVEAQTILQQADLIIAALGYKPNALPLFEDTGAAIPLAEAPAPLVDRRCRVIGTNGEQIPGVFGIGLAAGFVPSGPLGGEPSFRGQTNGIWLWQNGVGAMIVDALLSERVDHVDVPAAAE